MDHAFNVELAKQYDTDTAIFLAHLKHWAFKNLANKKHIHDGLVWSYDTLEAMADIFPYWSKRQLERVINNCVKCGLVVKGNYNATNYDRTCWYALTYKSYSFFPELLAPKYLQILYSSISPNGEINFTEWGNQFPQTVTTIPDTDPYTDPDTNTPISPKGENVHFEKFWDLYPVHKSKKACFEKWRKKKLDDIADEIISKLDIQILNDRAWVAGFIPNPLTYLNQEKWTDEIDMRAQGSTPSKKSTDNFHQTMAKQNKPTKKGHFDEHGNFNQCYL